jgi:hypothetical protein
MIVVRIAPARGRANGKIAGILCHFASNPLSKEAIEQHTKTVIDVLLYGVLSSNLRKRGSRINRKSQRKPRRAAEQLAHGDGKRLGSRLQRKPVGNNAVGDVRIAGQQRCGHINVAS